VNGRHNEQIEQVALLAEPVRRRVYEAVVGAAEPLDRDAAAAAAGVSRPLAAFHLDRLVRAGLLEAAFRRRSGRTGPGAGRPAKFYRRPVDATVNVSLPARTYDVAADVFAAALEAAATSPDTVREVAAAAGHAAAREVPASRRAGARPTSRAALLGVLATRGFEPREAAHGGVELGNCPFRALTADHRELTCGANLALVSALADDFPGARLVAERRDPPAPCCVGLRSTGPWPAPPAAGAERPA
jgi:predicted ArsR family transcriptional regulator